MATNCGDTLSLQDLQTAKKHQIFEAEVITGKQGGVAGGADIDYATNQVTGQVQKTMPAILRDIGFEPSSFDFTTGGTLGANDRNKVVYDPVSKAWYSWGGMLPHVIAAGTNPVGVADWTPQSDPNIRTDLASPDSGSLMVGYTTPQNGIDTTVGEALGWKMPNIIGSITTPTTGAIFDSLKTYGGDHDICFINGGSATKSTKKYKKTGNAQIVLNPVDGITPPAWTVDTVAYINPASPDTSGTPVVPQGTALNQLTFEGTDAGGECGLAILQGSDLKLSKLGFRNTKIALWMKDVWMTSISGITALGQIRHEGGTSVNYTNCFAKVTDPTAAHGAYHLSGLNYSTLMNCASDGTIATAYWFDGCHAVNVINCGSELPSSPGAGYGAALTVGSNCQMTFDGFYCFPKTGETEPLAVIFADNDLVFNNTLFQAGNTTGYDFYIHGANNKITINGGKYNNGSFPKIGVSSSAVGTVIKYSTASGQYICKVTASTPELITFEPLNEYRILDGVVSVSFGASPSGITAVSKDVKMTKAGGLVTVEYFLQFSGEITQTGELFLKGLPYVSKDIASGSVSQVGSVASSRGQFSTLILRGSSDVRFFKLESVNSTPVNETDLTASTTIAGSITYGINSNFN